MSSAVTFNKVLIKDIFLILFEFSEKTHDFYYNINNLRISKKISGESFLGRIGICQDN